MAIFCSYLNEGSRRRLLSGAVALACALGSARPARAAAAPWPSAAISVTVANTSSPNLTLDSNKPCVSGPQAAYIHFRVTNTGATTLRHATAILSGFANGIALGGNQAASQPVKSLASGASTTLFYFIAYPCTIGLATTLTLTVTDTTGSSASGSATFTTTSMLSSQAGGKLISANLGGSMVLGAVTDVDVVYEFGGSSAGDTFNFQAAGNQDFDARCFQLVGTQVMASADAAVPVGTIDQLFFTAATATPGSRHQITIRFSFRARCLGISSAAKPYANETSGTSLKYSSNYGTFTPPTFGAPTNPYTTAKTASVDTLSNGGSVTYTVTVTNGGTAPGILDSLLDVLPTGATFGAIQGTSGITAANSTRVPAAGASGAVVFVSDLAEGYPVAAGGSITAVYTVTISSAIGSHANSARPYIATSLVGTATATVIVARTANVRVFKAGADSARVGDTLSYVLQVNNAGPFTATGITLRDSLPVGLRFLSATRAPTVTAIATGQLVVWATVDSLKADSSRADTLYVIADSAKSLTNLAAATSTTRDTVSSDNNGSASASRKTTTVTASFYAVTVTPDGLGAPVKRLPSGAYAQAFVITNASGRSTSFDVLSRMDTVAQKVARADSITGALLASATPDSVRLALPSAVADTFRVWYSITAGAVVAENVLYLRARVVNDTSVKDDGHVDLRRVFPNLTLQKAVSPSVVTPGDTLTYTVTFWNAGEFAARNPVVTDVLPTEVQLAVGSVATSLPAGVTATLAYSLDGAAWTYSPVSGGCGAPTGFDACVRQVRATLAGDLAADATSAQGTLTFLARLP